MNIHLDNVGKRFNKQWVFKDVSLAIPEYSSIAITGANGSGKSTLMQITAGYMNPSRGEIKYDPTFENTQLHFNYAAPYFELIEEYTLNEFLHFHSQFKTPRISIMDMCRQANLIKSENKQLTTFSSGMKQRVKLMLALFYEAKVIFLDEPTANLDQDGIQWYKNEIQNINDSTIIIASNQSHEYDFVSKTINIENFTTSYN